MIAYKQVTIADVYSECQNILENDKPAFLTLLERHINLEEILAAPTILLFQ